MKMIKLNACGVGGELYRNKTSYYLGLTFDDCIYLFHFAGMREVNLGKRLGYSEFQEYCIKCFLSVFTGVP